MPTSATAIIAMRLLRTFGKGSCVKANAAQTTAEPTAISMNHISQDQVALAAFLKPLTARISSLENNSNVFFAA